MKPAVGRDQPGTNRLSVEWEPCGFPMWPGGPECVREPGHPITARSAHWGVRGDQIQWSYTSCWREVQGDSRCILPLGHEPTHSCQERRVVVADLPAGPHTVLAIDPATIIGQPVRVLDGGTTLPESATITAAELDDDGTLCVTIEMPVDAYQQILDAPPFVSLG